MEKWHKSLISHSFILHCNIGCICYSFPTCLCLAGTEHITESFSRLVILIWIMRFFMASTAKPFLGVHNSLHKHINIKYLIFIIARCQILALHLYLWIPSPFQISIVLLWSNCKILQALSKRYMTQQPLVCQRGIY